MAANADSGVFLREPQLQCRDFVLAGPWKDLQKYRAGDWNELVVEVTGTVRVGRAFVQAHEQELGDALPTVAPEGGVRI